MTLPASDTFTGSDSTPLTSYSANWAINAGAFIIMTNGVRSDGSGGAAEGAARWAADSFTADQYAQLKIKVTTGSLYIGPAVRIKIDGTANYYGYYTSSGIRYLFKVVNGIPTYLAEITADVFNDDVLYLEIASTLLTPKINGVLDTAIGAQTDSAHPTGQAGICGYGSGVGVIGDDFLADNIGAPAVTGVGGDWIQSEFLPYAVGAGGGMYGGG
jgi:hypothetical protein